ncbi:MAG: electron transport complex subunit RsxC [Candidatus Accumulibacter sp. 66-26]|nr:electron transport complex subunit RsxC [Accumulibacter sp.]OJW51958.1 MAG: electron transport complex subunit RsxC [Candidatus Accumulibacter sp. 66-26]
MLQRLFKFKGGVKPQTNKTQSVGLPIAVAPLPTRLIVPLHQSIGGTPDPLVAPGERVLKGQKIGGADGWISSAVHAPTSGTVLAVEERVAPHPSGLPTLSVIIEPDGRDEWITRTPVDYKALAPETVREMLRDAGVVGLGGAVFPSHAKLSASKTVPMEELVINGAECEPYITCDDLLMRERAEDVVRGVGLFRDLLRPKRVLIGIEDNKPEAVAAMKRAVQALGEDFAVIAVPTRYPAGGAKQLIRVLTGKEVPAAKRSTELGVQCFNVATAYTAWRAVAHGEPVISRIVTLTGNVAQPRNWEVLIGTPLAEFVALGQPKADTDGYLMGGPMMGFEMPSPDAPLVKATNCIIAGSPTLFPPKAPEMPCIRCGECAKACPHELQPFELYWFARAKNFGKTQEYSIFDCIECGCCSYVCPSRIPLVQYFRFAKSEIWAREREKNAADTAKARFEFRNLRDEREKAEKAERLAKAAAAKAAEKKAEPAPAAPAADAGIGAPAAADGGAPAAAPLDAEAVKKATIAAAIERARQQREAVQPKNTDRLTPAQQKEIAEIEARRAPLQAEQPERSAPPATDAAQEQQNQ